MEVEQFFELTKNGRIFILLGSLSVIIGLSIDNYLLIIPGLFFWLIISSAFVHYLTTQNVSFEVDMRISKEHLRSRGLLAVAVILTNRSNKKLRIKTQLHFSYHFRSINQSDHIYLKLEPDQEQNIVWTLLAARRGNAEIGPIEIAIGPYQQLFKNIRILKKVETIKVLPQRPRINIPWKTKKELLLKMVHEFAQRVKGRGDEFFALRDYLPGDEVKHIDWFATARHDKLITKEYEDERNLHFLIYLDLGSAMFGPKFEYSLSSAVEISSLIRGTNHDLAIIAYGDNVSKFIVPQVGKNELRLMLNLYDIEPTGVESNFINAVKFTKTNRLNHSITIIFSDLEGDLKKKLQGLHLLHSMGSRVIFVNFSTMDFNILASSKWIVGGAQNKEYQDILDEIFPSLVKDEYLRRETEVRKILYSIGGDYIEINGYEDNIILSLYKLMKKYSPSHRLVQEALGR
ncbi:MAG: hypothetical protein HeimAB125_00160 [Candidatus Heimdallarchaeota archaeon AB_125]|nr:MAG: hypothetical protein HeimAB125_00160 [Candidatus Heimdallarchaeota archaeon AB_125]